MNDINTYKILILCIFFLFGLSGVTEAAPSKLKAIPNSATEIQLEWTSFGDEQYDVWQSRDGLQWKKVTATLPKGSDTYIAKTGIEGWKNYYFVITVSGDTTYPAGFSSGINASNETVSYPPTKHAHSYFPTTTDVCKNCHSAHTAKGPKLLAQASLTDTCVSCHDGSQSKYNILDGKVSRDGTFNNPLDSPAGPYGNLSGLNSTAQPKTIHRLGMAVDTAPGGNPGGTTPGWTEALSCASCHDVHDSSNYRLITRRTPDNPEVSVKAYAYSDFILNKETVNYVSGINTMCMGCHKDYYALGGAGNTPATGTYTNDGKYRHAVGVNPATYKKGALFTTLPLEGSNTEESPKVISCITCHFAHGSEAETNDEKTYAESEKVPTNWLLRMDYRGVCQDCHKK